MSLDIYDPLRMKSSCSLSVFRVSLEQAIKLLSGYAVVVLLCRSSCSIWLITQLVQHMLLHEICRLALELGEQCACCMVEQLLFHV